MPRELTIIQTCEGHSRWLVGKSIVTTNLAASLALKGYHVGVCVRDSQP